MRSNLEDEVDDINCSEICQNVFIHFPIKCDIYAFIYLWQACC